MRVGSLEVAATRAQARPEAAPGVAVKPQRAHCNAGCALRNAGTARAAAAAVGCYIRTLLILDLTAAFPSTRRARFWGKSSMAVFSLECKYGWDANGRAPRLRAVQFSWDTFVRVCSSCTKTDRAALINAYT